MQHEYHSKPAPFGMRRVLNRLYRQYNRPEYVYPDPLALVLRHRNPRDREIAGLIAASLAFGNVHSILRSAERVLALFPRPAEDIALVHTDSLPAELRHFRHRYVTGRELSALLRGIQGVLRAHGTLERCFLAHFRDAHPTVLPGLIGLADELRAQGNLTQNYLLPDPRRGSACKRWFMFLRWMIRRDAVDPGPWRVVSPAKLLMPVDVHIHRIARALGWTTRNTADLKTSLEITDVLRIFAPRDPVRYDFALARLGIHPDADLKDFLRVCATVRGEQDLAD